MVWPACGVGMSAPVEPERCHFLAVTSRYARIGAHEMMETAQVVLMGLPNARFLGVVAGGVNVADAKG